MKIVRPTVFLALALVATGAIAQNAGQPLNLKLPAGVAPAPGSSAAAPANTADTATKPADSKATPSTTSATGNTTSYSKDPPGTYYGDTTGSTEHDQALAGRQAVACDDATYNQPQVHGSVGMGVMAGNHVSGSYTGGAVTMSQAFGSCEHPTGGMSISVSGTQSHFGH